MVVGLGSTPFSRFLVQPAGLSQWVQVEVGLCKWLQHWALPRKGNCDRGLPKASKQVSCHPYCLRASLLACVLRKTGTVLHLRYPDDSHIKYVTFS